MVTLAKDYGRTYAQLKHRIGVLRLQLLYSALNDKTLTYAEYLDRLAKDLDILYSDGRYFDDLEIKIEQLEK